MPINIPPQKNCTFLFASSRVRNCTSGVITVVYVPLPVYYCCVLFKSFYKYQFFLTCGDLKKHKALATFTAYASYPALDCLSQNFVQCGQAINKNTKFFFIKTLYAQTFYAISYMLHDECYPDGSIHLACLQKKTSASQVSKSYKSS